jgi:hypothetical protein
MFLVDMSVCLLSALNVEAEICQQRTSHIDEMVTTVAVSHQQYCVVKCPGSHHDFDWHYQIPCALQRN